MLCICRKLRWLKSFSHPSLGPHWVSDRQVVSLFDATRPRRLSVSGHTSSWARTEEEGLVPYSTLPIVPGVICCPGHYVTVESGQTLCLLWASVSSSTFFLSGGIMMVTLWALTISWKRISLLGNHVPKVLPMSRHFRRPRVQAWLQKWACDPGQASQVQNLWALQRRMDCWGLLSSAMNLEWPGPLPHTGWAWSQTVWKAEPMDCEKQSWWKSVPLINIPTVWAFEAQEPKTFLFFPKPFS